MNSWWMSVVAGSLIVIGCGESLHSPGATAGMAKAPGPSERRNERPVQPIDVTGTGCPELKREFVFEPVAITGEPAGERTAAVSLNAR